MLVVSKKGYAFAIHNFIYVMCCFTSQYLYATYVCFGEPVSMSASYWVMISFESFFFLNIIFTFFVEYEVEGKL